MAEAVGLMRVATPGEVDRLEREKAAISDKALGAEAFRSSLANHIHAAFERARNHQESEGIKEQLLSALRTYRGEYSPEKLREISAFAGSRVYARLTAVKCRGAAAILRDIYLTSERPWFLGPTPEPVVPGQTAASVMQLVQAEVETLRSAGQQVDPQAVEDRVTTLMDAAKKAERRKAELEADKATLKLEDRLREGGFYKALSEVLVDLPIFLFACMKGPVVRKVSTFKWLPDGNKEMVDEPRMFWERVSPFDLYFSPGASEVSRATILERVRLTRDELFDLIGLPGYDEDAIRRVLGDMSTGGAGGLMTWMTYFESERATLERRENPLFDSEMLYIDALEYSGTVRGQWLLDWGVPEREVPDPDREYFATCWMINNDIIKAQVSPNPSQRPNYYITSFEKVPGSLYGHGLPNILNDIQEVANATLRALVNNLAIASGPQVIVDDERIAVGADSDSLYPWKRWHVVSDPLSQGSKPVDFFQPVDNSQSLLGVYKEFTNMADEISAIPRFLTGSQRTGGAAATASGLAMLMGNASKVMQNVAANVDEDIIEPAVQALYDMVMLTDPGELRGDENVIVRGVTNAIQREQDRMRQLEFLQMTANPIDMQIIGPRGRASVLRAVAENLGLEYESIVAEDEEMLKMLEQQNQQQQPAGPSQPKPQTQTPLVGAP
jgi:hypothetical protein